jgi:hypothetical protein
MSDFIECLADVQEDSCAVLLFVQGFVNDISETVTLLYCGVSFSESELVQWYPRLEMGVGVYPFK